MYRRDEKYYTKCLSENMKEGDPLEDAGVAGRIILEWILEKQCGEVWTRYIWLRIGACNKRLLASQEEPYSLQLVN